MGRETRRRATDPGDDAARRVPIGCPIGARDRRKSSKTARRPGLGDTLVRNVRLFVSVLPHFGRLCRVCVNCPPAGRRGASSPSPCVSTFAGTGYLFIRVPDRLEKFHLIPLPFHGILVPLFVEPLFDLLIHPRCVSEVLTVVDEDVSFYSILLTPITVRRPHVISRRPPVLVPSVPAEGIRDVISHSQSWYAPDCHQWNSKKLVVSLGGRFSQCFPPVFPWSFRNISHTFSQS